MSWYVESLYHLNMCASITCHRQQCNGACPRSMCVLATPSVTAGRGARSGCGVQWEGRTARTAHRCCYCFCGRCVHRGAPPLLVPAVHGSDMKRQKKSKTSTHGANSKARAVDVPKGDPHTHWYWYTYNLIPMVLALVQYSSTTCGNAPGTLLVYL